MSYILLLEEEKIKQSEFEKSVFIAFSKVAPFKVEKDTIVSLSPPEPDILCSIEGRGLVGFELTELIDKAYMERTSLMLNTIRFLNDYWINNLTKKQTDVFLNKYGGALLHFEFSNEAKLKERKSKAKKAFELLLGLEGKAEGVQLENNIHLMPALQEVRISHLELDTPMFDVGSFNRLGDPTESAIRKKINKSYTCKYPIELLAHIEMNLLPPEDVWVATVEKIAPLIEGSHFKKVWIFDRSSNEIKYQYEA